MAYSGCGSTNYADENSGTFSWQSVGNIVDWDVLDKIIIALGIEEIADHSPDASTQNLQWRNITDGGSWTNLTGSGEMIVGTTTGYADGDNVAAGEVKATSGAPCGGGGSYEEANSYKDETGSEAFQMTTKFNYTEAWYCIDPANALAGKEYEFQIYDSDRGARLTEGTHYTLKIYSAGLAPQPSDYYSMRRRA